LQCLCLASFIARAAPSAAAAIAAADAALTLPLHVHHATGKKPVALMIAPTRELALQIAAVLEEAGSQCGIRWGRYARAACILGLRYARCDCVVGLRYGSCFFLALSRLSCFNTFFSRLTATDL
jgi:hypothetical protein